jgi:hypothetical protein
MSPQPLLGRRRKRKRKRRGRDATILRGRWAGRRARRARRAPHGAKRAGRRRALLRVKEGFAKASVVVDAAKGQRAKMERRGRTGRCFV